MKLIINWLLRRVNASCGNQGVDREFVVWVRSHHDKWTTLLQKYSHRLLGIDQIDSLLQNCPIPCSAQNYHSFSQNHTDLCIDISFHITFHFFLFPTFVITMNYCIPCFQKMTFLEIIGTVATDVHCFILLLLTFNLLSLNVHSVW